MARDFERSQEIRMLYFIARLNAEAAMLQSLTDYALKKGDVNFGLSNIVHQTDQVQSIAGQIKGELFKTD